METVSPAPAAVVGTTLLSVRQQSQNRPALCLVYINTLMIQRVLTEPDWTQRMLPEDLRALTPLIYSHVTPYGTFRLDMSQRLAIEQDAVAA
jgi:Tn3 transposase DDE domain-containing protein